MSSKHVKQRVFFFLCTLQSMGQNLSHLPFCGLGSPTATHHCDCGHLGFEPKSCHREERAHLLPPVLSHTPDTERMESWQNRIQKLESNVDAIFFRIDEIARCLTNSNFYQNGTRDDLENLSVSERYSHPLQTFSFQPEGVEQVLIEDYERAHQMCHRQGRG